MNPIQITDKCGAIMSGFESLENSTFQFIDQDLSAFQSLQYYIKLGSRPSVDIITVTS